MLSLKLLRSLVLGETINDPFLLTQNHRDHDDNDANNATIHSPSKINATKTKTPILLFMPTKELVTDTYRLATIARDMGMDLNPTPSLSHIILSYPSSSSSSLLPTSWSSSSLSLPNGAVPLPFPSLINASLSHLRSFVTLSKGLFKLVFVKHYCNNTNGENGSGGGDNISNWNCCSLSLFSRLTGDRMDTMDGFSKALAGKGWTLFKSKDNPLLHSGNCRGNSVYLFRKVDSSRVRGRQANGGSATCGECRIRELRLPTLDFRNAPLRILQYILLMTDDIFYLA